MRGVHRFSSMGSRRRHWLVPAIGSTLLLVVMAAVGWSIVGGGSLGGLVGEAPSPGSSSPEDVLDPLNPIVRAALGAGLRGDALSQEVQEHHAESPVPENSLWSRQRNYAADNFVIQWMANREVEFPTVGFAAWEVPADPTWRENPYSNVSWRTQYQSLGWLLAPIQAYRQTGEARYLREVKRYIFDWIATNGNPENATPRAWYDHAVALRTDFVVYAEEVALAGNLTAEEYSTLLGALDVHARYLDILLDDPAYRGHNHGLLHAMALYNLAVAFPELKSSSHYLEHARRRIGELADEMVDDDGVSLEQAMSYHYLAVNLFRQAATFLQLHSDDLAGRYRSKLMSMTDFGAVVLSPLWTVPAIGDTNFETKGGSAALEAARQLGLSGEYAEFVLSRGTRGRRPPDILVYRNAGYVVIRRSWGDSARWKYDAQLVFDTGPKRRVHGHDDALSFVFYADGQPVIVDPGGPYLYGSAQHEAFVSAYAHNTIVRSDRSDTLGDARLLRTTTGSRFSEATAEVGDGNLVHIRTILLIDANVVVVLDRLTSSGRRTETELRYHLAPGVQVAAQDDSAEIGLDGRQTRMVFWLEGSSRVSVIDGALVPAIDGWVTTSYSKRTAAPVLVISGGLTPWYATAIMPRGAASRHVKIERVAGEFKVSVSDGDGPDLVLHVPDEGTVQSAVGQSAVGGAR